MRNQDQLREIYLFIFDNFAATTREIESHFHISKAVALSRCKCLSQLGLVNGEIVWETHGGLESGPGVTPSSRPGSTFMWQCWESNDYLSREEAVSKFEEAISEKKGESHVAVE